jgi:hypothetical protein
MSPMPLTRAGAALAVLAALAAPAPAHARPGEAEESVAARIAARPPVRFQRAADLLPGAVATARAWSSDASLAYVENDDSLAVDGSSRRWTFVFHAPERGESRAFTFGDSGRVTSFALPFAFDPPAVEDGWIEPSALLPGFAWAEGPARPAVAGAHVAVLSRGLLPGRDGNVTTWYVGRVRGPGAVLDALRGTTLSAQGPGLAGDAGAADGGAPGDGALPAFLRAHRASFLARLERERSDPARARRERTRALAAREGAALERLAASQAVFDTLGRGAVEASGRDVDRALARIAAWRAEEAKADSLLAASEARLAAAEKDLAAGRPTELALYLSLERRARPATVRVVVDGAEIARRTYGTPEWNALDAGAWSEVVRATVRPGVRQVEVHVEGADHRLSQATWAGALAGGTSSALWLHLRGSGEGRETPPRLERIAGTTP